MEIHNHISGKPKKLYRNVLINEVNTSGKEKVILHSMPREKWLQYYEDLLIEDREKFKNTEQHLIQITGDKLHITTGS